MIFQNIKYEEFHIMSITIANNITTVTLEFLTKLINDVKDNKNMKKELLHHLETDEIKSALSEIIVPLIPKSSKASSKTKRDPLKPKKPASAYLRYCNDHRAAVVSKMTIDDVKPKQTEVLKALGASWKEFNIKAEKKGSKEKKQLDAWMVAVAADKALYDEKMETYVPAPGTGSTKKKANTDPLKPKKPVSAYVLYTADARVDIKNNNPEIATKDILSVIGKKWTDFKKSASKSDKKKMEKYKATVTGQKEEYDEKMKTYQPSAGYDEKGRLIKSEEELTSIADAKKAKSKKSSAKKSSAKKGSDEESSDEESSDEDVTAKKSTKKMPVKAEDSDSSDSD